MYKKTIVRNRPEINVWGGNYTRGDLKDGLSVLAVWAVVIGGALLFAYLYPDSDSSGHSRGLKSEAAVEQHMGIRGY